ncbi:Tubulin alpha-3 chain [Clonorchis sinensis]|uniref:Tubulin alpha-3 chain n=1 Tax=Clonorchis sinensis TaxID=79923 RepID=A0A8T1LX47_CLOSI|nr:Tubulin alpha-3 chain [Clonorchis sinensis]
MRGELVQFFIGQYGLQVGNAVWELACAENGLDCSGSPQDKSFPLDDHGVQTLFSQTPSGKFVPRCALIDTEPTVIDEIRIGHYRSLFNPQNLVSGWEDSASNFARGYYRNARKILQPTLEVTRRLVEACDDLQSFVFHQSHTGGTGSGFTASLLENLHDEYTKKIRFSISLLPSDAMSTCIVEAYNTLLSCHVPNQYIDFTILTDNKALLTACVERIGIWKPTMYHLNRVQAQVVSGVVSPLLFKSQLSAGLPELLTNLVPYPEAHLIIGSLSPLRGGINTNYEALSCCEITEQAFRTQNQLLSSPAAYQPTYLSCCLLYRGGVTAKHINNAIIKLKKSGNLPWVDWCPTGFKVAVSNQPMTVVPSSCIGQTDCSLLMLHNSTRIIPALSHVLDEFRMLFSRRAFVHWYTTEGMDEAQFIEASLSLAQIRDEYIQFQRPNMMGDLRDKETSNLKSPEVKQETAQMKNFSASPNPRPRDHTSTGSLGNTAPQGRQLSKSAYYNERLETSITSSEDPLAKYIQLDAEFLKDYLKNISYHSSLDPNSYKAVRDSTLDVISEAPLTSAISDHPSDHCPTIGSSSTAEETDVPSTSRLPRASSSSTSEGITTKKPRKRSTCLKRKQPTVPEQYWHSDRDKLISSFPNTSREFPSSLKRGKKLFNRQNSNDPKEHLSTNKCASTPVHQVEIDCSHSGDNTDSSPIESLQPSVCIVETKGVSDAVEATVFL